MVLRKRLTAVGVCLLANAWGCAEWKSLPQMLSESHLPDIRPLRKERASEAVRDFDRRRSDAEFQAAQACWRQGDYEQACDALEKITARDPAHREALFLLSDVHLERDRPTEAVRVMRSACEQLPDDAEVAYRLGLALEANDRVAEAVVCFQQATAAEPHERRFADALTQAEAYAREEAEKAGRLASEILDEVPQAVHDEFADALQAWKEGRDQEAAERLARFLSKRPNYLEAEILQAEIDLHAGRRAAALARVDRLAARHPGNIQVMQAGGMLYDAAGDGPRAAQFYATAKAVAARGEVVRASYEEPADSQEPEPPSVPKLLPPTDDAARVPAETLVVADDGALEVRTETADARQLLTQALAREQRDPQTAIDASAAALKAEQPELAYDLATSGIAAFPASAPLHRIRGWASYRLGRYGEARESLERSLSLDNSQGLSYFLLGSVLNRLGDTAAAERNFREAARLDSRYAVRK